jgi:hypothetical protein
MLRTGTFRGFVVFAVAAIMAVALGWTAPATAAASKTYSYSVETKGAVGQNVETFAGVVASIYGDPRGWSLGGSVEFKRVASGGDFTIWLTQASQVPTFSSECSSEWSCRVGRNIVVNNDRWMTGTALTSTYGMSLDDYRHLLVNHETGHYLGFGHTECPVPGGPASIMQQQSKGGSFLGGCTPNAWPRTDEKQVFANRIGVSIVTKPRSVGIAAAKNDDGYWTVTNGGGVLAYGNATFHGSASGLKLVSPIVGIAATSDGAGYWLVASDGGIFAYGTAKFYGSMGGKPLNKPIVGMVATPSDKGYWLVASDGGVFAYGDAKFYGSMGGKPLNRPVVGISRSATGLGYRLVASDGGIFAYGDAPFYGSMGGKPLNRSVVGMTATSTGLGYMLVAGDGGVFAYGDAKFFGSTATTPSSATVVSIAARHDNNGYWLLRDDEKVTGFGAAVSY